MKALKNRVIIFFLLLLAGHVAHVFEEVRGNFRLIKYFPDPGWFLLVNWILFLIPLGIFYFVLNEKRPAYYAGIIYAGVMVLNGIGHNIATLVTGKYFNGFAGGFSGILLIIAGIFLIFYLVKSIKMFEE